MKKFILLFTMLFLVSCAGNVPDEKTPDAPPHQFKWDVSVCNNVGCNHYYCDAYQRDGDTYKLLRSDTVSDVIQIVPGIAKIFSKGIETELDIRATTQRKLLYRIKRTG